MFWGCVRERSKGNSVRIDGKMTAACYQKILEDHLHSSAWKLRVTMIQNTKPSQPFSGFNMNNVKVL